MINLKFFVKISIQTPQKIILGTLIFREIFSSKIWQISNPHNPKFSLFILFLRNKLSNNKFFENFGTFGVKNMEFWVPNFSNFVELGPPLKAETPKLFDVIFRAVYGICAPLLCYRSAQFFLSNVIVLYLF